jgi:outer membrane protein with beta-barrel domain
MHMTSTRTALLVACVVLAGAARADAQDKGDTGLVIGFPTSIGLIWHASDRLAIRPEVSFGGAHTETTIDDALSTEADSTTFSIGGSAIWYVRRWDNLRAYVVPRLVYSRSDGSSESQVSGIELESSSRSFALSGAFGTQYSLHDRFSVFGEIGLAWTDSSSESGFGTSGDGTSWGTRSSVGVVFYF